MPWRSEASKIREVDTTVVKNNKCQQMEDIVLMDDGSLMIFLSSKTPIVRNNKIIGIVGVSIDITERVNLEQKLAEKERKINHIRQSKS